ncbi:MAG: carbamoyltransferase HypF [Acidobacteria bacterium]|nr:carbamoyltransferase HypF [Acidobacteriota bacterium]
MQVSIRGAVQGVGFRPFVYRLASNMKLPGRVLNSPQGVFIEVEGQRADLEAFLLRLQHEKPAPASIQSLEFSFLDPVGFADFKIRSSDPRGERSTLILPDIAVCAACLEEISDPDNRRYRYPFTNCTHCGPRFTIIESLPYDRPNTSMKSFEMCPECLREYEDPLDRRFHAQPNACPACGPALELWDPSGCRLADKEDALLQAAEAIREGKIVAVKGIGGFHLMADAGSDRAVAELRGKKHREEKPFALMYPSLERISLDCEVSRLETRLLTSPESPIVILRRNNSASSNSIAPSVAPGNPCLGVMLPYTPLHHLLMRELGMPVVATSGNISDEPICTDEGEALTRLSSIADLYLVHDRPIVRHVDDSIVRVMMGRELVLRRARGYAPLPLRYGSVVPGILAVGAHLKNTFAVSVDDNIFISQHIGDLENREASEAFRKGIESFRSLYRFDPRKVVADMHPDYVSSKFARECGTPAFSVQHHYAHVAACMAENELDGTVLGVAWDGTGFGPDGTVWGGEFLLTNRKSFDRVASFRTFRLPGGEAAIREPRRTALGALYEVMGERVFERRDLLPVQAFGKPEISVMAQMLRKGLHCPWTSSAGRLFDAVASIAGLRQKIRFEGQAAMDVEFAIGALETEESYPFTVIDRASADSCDRDSENSPDPRFSAGMIVDWEPAIRAIVGDIGNAVSPAQVSIRFHNTLVEAIVEVSRRVGETRVVLTGGCFQNRYLLERAVRKLEAAGLRPYWHQRIPPNDGGIAPGQIVAVSRMLKQMDNEKP